MTKFVPAKLKNTEFLLFLTIFTTIVFFSEIAYQTSNYTSRLFLTEAIVDHQTFSLDAYEERLGVDYAVYDGHLYSDKPPGASILMLPQYLLLGKPVKWLLSTLGINMTVQGYAVKDVLAGWLVQIFSLGLYTAVSFTALHRILTQLQAKRPFRLSLLTYFGTLIIVYSTIGTGEMFTVPFLLFGLHYLLKALAGGIMNGEQRIKNNEPPLTTHQTTQSTNQPVNKEKNLRASASLRESFAKNKNLLYAGFFYGLAFFVTNQVLLFILIAALTILINKSTQSTNQPFIIHNSQFIIHYLLFPFFFALLTLAYNYLLFDHPLHFPQQYWVQGDPQVVLFGLQPITKLLDMFILPTKGIFFYSPMLLLALPGLNYLYRRLPGSTAYRQTLTLLFGGSILVYLIFYFFNLGWAGGSDYGWRYIVIATPFLAVPAALWIDQQHFRPLNWKRLSNWKAPLTLLLITLSVAICTFGAITDPEVPTGVPNPIVNYTWPRFIQESTNNLPNQLLDQFLHITSWPLRLATTLLFFAALALILYRTRPKKPGF